MIKLKRNKIISINFNRRFQHTNIISNAITYNQNGNPAEVLKLKQLHLNSPEPNQLGLKFILSPLNPADINTIQGRYPWKPKKYKINLNLKNEDEFYIGGNEGLAEIISIGNQIDPINWNIGDWVIMGKPQLGTWRSHANLSVEDVIKLPKLNYLNKIQAATLSVNISTAYRLIKDYYIQKKNKNSNDCWIIQNGANSSVGQYVLQFCKAWDIPCIGLIRDRPQVNQLKSSLINLGALNKTQIFTYDEISKDSSLFKSFDIQLGFNCISGNIETNSMMKLMSNASRLITYGGMSMKPLTIPISNLIFKDIKVEGFMLTNWLMKNSMDERKKMLIEILNLIQNGNLKHQFNTEILLIDSNFNPFDFFNSLNKSKFTKKILFQF